MDHFTEINTDAQQKLVIDGDEESVTESNGNSQRREDNWSSASESRRRDTTEGFKVPVLPLNIGTLPPDTPRKKISSTTATRSQS
ncbi:unnamed protein product [Caenorhabditis nigoni]